MGPESTARNGLTSNTSHVERVNGNQFIGNQFIGTGNSPAGKADLAAGVEGPEREGRMSLTPEPEWQGKAEVGVSTSGQNASSSGEVSEVREGSADPASSMDGMRPPGKPVQNQKVQAAARKLLVQSQLQRWVGACV